VYGSHSAPFIYNGVHVFSGGGESFSCVGKRRPAQAHDARVLDSVEYLLF
jgi:hypothetical protein